MSDPRAQLVASLELFADALVPLVEERLRLRVHEDPPRRRLYSLAELERLGWDAGRLRYLARIYRAELLAAGAVIRGRPLLVDAELLEDVVQDLAVERRQARADARRRRRATALRKAAGAPPRPSRRASKARAATLAAPRRRPAVRQEARHVE